MRHRAAEGIALGCARWRIFVLVCGRIQLTGRGLFLFSNFVIFIFPNTCKDRKVILSFIPPCS